MLAAWLAARLVAGKAAALVTVTGVQGSAPREAGAAMGVSADGICGTIGGGALEAQATEAARLMLVRGDHSADIDQPLGPEIGQCCGGRVQLRIDRVNEATVALYREGEGAAAAIRPSVLIFGAGHTGSALARALAPLPLNISVIDQRADWLTKLGSLEPGSTVKQVETALPEAEVTAAPSGAAFVIMTHDHALDFMIAEAALARGDAAYVGVIGSGSKRARLIAELARKGVTTDALVCPIGGAGPKDKRPAVIAAATAAEIAAALL